MIKPYTVERLREAHISAVDQAVRFVNDGLITAIRSNGKEIKIDVPEYFSSKIIKEALKKFEEVGYRVRVDGLEDNCAIVYEPAYQWIWFDTCILHKMIGELT